MKTIFRVTLIFVLLMFGIYYLPQILAVEGHGNFIQRDSQMAESGIGYQNNLNSTNQDVLPVSGMAAYVSQPITLIQEVYGNPNRSFPSVDGSEWQVYSNEDEQYFQVNVKDGRVVQLFSLGSALDVTPFKIGMSIDQIYKYAFFHPTYQIKYNQVFFELELSENDLHYTPLIKFEDDIFAVLMLNRQSNEIIAVHYLDTFSLLQSGLYSLDKEFPSFSTEDTSVAKKEREQGKRLSTVEILNQLRSRFGIPELEYSNEIEQIAESVFSFQKSMESVPQGETAESFKESEGDPEDINSSFSSEKVLTSAVVESALKETGRNMESFRFLYSPNDSNFLWSVPHWFSLERQREILVTEQMKRIGIVYRNEEVLLLMDNALDDDL